jgi:tRNA G10  N-methylase Trm11
MQVFIIGSPFQTAEILDRRRLNKQIIECHQILDALNGKKAWSNHPAVLQYKDHKEWLELYMFCLEDYYSVKYNNVDKDMLYLAKEWSDRAFEHKPDFHTEEYFKQMKRRLYTKDKTYYQQWKELGETDINWYFVDGEWRYYQNGKRIKN